VARPREPWKRQRLLDAAASTIARGGVGNLTVKDVAQAAGVSTATVHYHFEDLEGLLLGVVERASDRMYAQRAKAIDAIASIEDKLWALIDMGVPDEESTEVAMMYDAIAVVRSNSSYRAMVKSYVERQVSLYRSVIDAGAQVGIFTLKQPAGVVARNLVALEDAFDLYLTVGTISDAADARDQLQAYARLALGIDEVKGSKR
jgi:AcrR family transcriptional regulator